MSGVNRLRVTPRIEFGLWPPLRASSQTTVVIAIAPTAAAMIADFLCCLILLTMYSALDVDLPDCSVVCRPGVSVPPADRSAQLSPAPAPATCSPRYPSPCQPMSAVPRLPCRPRSKQRGLSLLVLVVRSV